jgi:hypothetical protein
MNIQFYDLNQRNIQLNLHLRYSVMSLEPAYSGDHYCLPHLETETRLETLVKRFS